MIDGMRLHKRNVSLCISEHANDRLIVARNERLE